MNRRDFLRPRHLARTAGHVLALADEVRPAAPPADVRLLRYSRRAMATQFEVVLPFGTPNGHAAAEAALDEIDRLETQLTVYHDSSEVSRVNRLAADGPVVIEQSLFELLHLASRLTHETGGAFDVTAGALVKAWGFFRGPRRVPSEQERTAALERVGMRHVQLDAERRSVRFLRPGVEFNLGSIGKGQALDRVAQLLQNQWNVGCGLLHGGHSSVYAIGGEPGTEHGWQVGIQHPWDEGKRLGILRLRDRAMGTSAATFRHLVYEGRKLGHILDPRSGWPAEGIASATVTAPSAAEADALATAFYILGVDAARAWCERRPEIGAVLLPEGAGAQAVVLGMAVKEIGSEASAGLVSER